MRTERAAGFDSHCAARNVRCGFRPAGNRQMPTGHLHSDRFESLAKRKMQEWLQPVLHFWSGLRDSNPRSLGPKPSAIPNFAKPSNLCSCGQICGQGNSTTIMGNFQEGIKGELPGKVGLFAIFSGWLRIWDSSSQIRCGTVLPAPG